MKGIDDNLGRLFAHLEATGQMDNTLIVYTADQGFMLGEHDYQDKRWMYEESLRMPFLIRYPKAIKSAQNFDTIIENVDFAPTLLDFAGANIPKSVQGKSFKSILESGKEPQNWKKAAYYRYWMHMAHHDNPAHVGMRTKRYKLIYFYGCNYQGDYQTPAGWDGSYTIWLKIHTKQKIFMTIPNMRNSLLHLNNGLLNFAKKWAMMVPITRIAKILFRNFGTTVMRTGRKPQRFRVII